MKEMDLVSIIVPVYNVKEYLERCIQSVIEQTYVEIEIILIDDGSNDGSEDICDRFAQQDVRIKVIHKENGGLSDARNKGLEVAHGKYVCFVDSDDFINPKMIEILLKIIKQYKVKISAARFKKVYENEQIENNSNDFEVEIYKNEDAIEHLFTEETYCNFAWNKMYDISLFSDIRYPFNKVMEDLGTTYKLVYKSKKVAYVKMELYYYFQRNDSILHTRNTKFYEDMLQLAIERYMFVNEKYPNLWMNKEYIIKVLMYCFPHIQDRYLLKEAKQIGKNIKLREFKKVNIKAVVWKIIFSLNSSLLICIEHMRQGGNE